MKSVEHSTMTVCPQCRLPHPFAKRATEFHGSHKYDQPLSGWQNLPWAINSHWWITSPLLAKYMYISVVPAINVMQLSMCNLLVMGWLPLLLWQICRSVVAEKVMTTRIVKQFASNGLLELWRICEPTVLVFLSQEPLRLRAWTKPRVWFFSLSA